MVAASALQEDFFTLLLLCIYGVGFGLVYGLGFAIGGWAFGRALVYFGVVERKGLALALGVAITAVFIVVFFSIDGTFDTFLVTIPCVVAVAVGIWRGRHYDLAVT